MNPKSLLNLRDPWPKGKSGNPSGRRTAGATIREWVNALASEGLSETQLRQIAKAKSAPVPKRAAALRLLRSVEQPDLADIEPWLRGTQTLQELRESGVQTDGVKKAKIKRIPTEAGEIEEREVELHDRSRDAFLDSIEQTDGKALARQETNVTAPGGIPILFPAIGDGTPDPGQ